MLSTTLFYTSSICLSITPTLFILFSALKLDYPYLIRSIAMMATR